METAGPQAPQSDPTPIINPSPEGGNKMVFWLVGGVVAILLVVGGIYYFLSKQQATIPASQTTSSTSEAQKSLESELDAIDVGDLDEEFSEVDKDLQSL